MTTKNLLVELFVEELPPKVLRSLGTQFLDGLSNGLLNQGLIGADPINENEWFASPRRLAAKIIRVSDKAADRSISQKLMPVSVGMDAIGKPTPALL